MYSLKLALKSLWYDKWINLLSIVSIATGLFILGTVLLSLYNIERATQNMPERFTITLFLNEKISKKDVDLLIKRLKRESIVKEIDYISKEDALKELKTSLKDAAYILEGLDENPLFPSIVIKVRRENFDRDRVEALIKKLKGFNQIDEIIYADEILESIQDVYSGFKFVSLGVSLLFSVSVVFVCYSTVKILFFRRKEEIEVYKLLGATRSFIRAPFIIEGTIIGIVGGVAALAGNYLLVSLLKGMTNPVAVLKLIEIPVQLMVILPVAGLVLGLTGSTIALGRLKY